MLCKAKDLLLFFEVVLPFLSNWLIVGIDIYDANILIVCEYCEYELVFVDLFKDLLICG